MLEGNALEVFSVKKLIGFLLSMALFCIVVIPHIVCGENGPKSSN